MGIHALKKEIQQTKMKLEKLEEELLTVQRTCTHLFVELKNYQQCSKCQKSEPLYY